MDVGDASEVKRHTAAATLPACSECQAMQQADRWNWIAVSTGCTSAGIGSECATEVITHARTRIPYHHAPLLSSPVMSPPAHSTEPSAAPPPQVRLVPRYSRSPDGEIIYYGHVMMSYSTFQTISSIQVACVAWERVRAVLLPRDDKDRCAPRDLMRWLMGKISAPTGLR